MGAVGVVGGLGVVGGMGVVGGVSGVENPTIRLNSAPLSLS